jgi:hypothetical protein
LLDSLWWLIKTNLKPEKCLGLLFVLQLIYRVTNLPKIHPHKHTRQKQAVGFEVLIAVVVESSVFWDIALCSLLKVNQRFIGTSRLHFQGRRIIQARHQCESHSKQSNWLAKISLVILVLFSIGLLCCVG